MLGININSQILNKIKTIIRFILSSNLSLKVKVKFELKFKSESEIQT